jgi:hypothetical protein
MFYNTTHEQGTQLTLFRKKSERQDATILHHFKQNPSKTFTAPELLKAIHWGVRPPLTSVRRAISDLERLGYIVKADKRDGMYGRSNFSYKLI